MKAALYALVHQNRWSWKVSLALEVDAAFWFEQYGGTVSIVVLEPAMSLGQAHALGELLAGGRGLMKKALVAGFPAGLAAALKVRHLSYEAYTREQVQAVQVQLNVLEQLEALLQGRSLTRDELAGLLEHAGLAPVREQEARYLQAAALRGTVELATGLERVKRERRWSPFARRERAVVLRCRRCGSGGSRLYATECPHCGGPCSYCEACLTMGRQRQCSLLIRGLAPAIAWASGPPGAAASDWARSLQGVPPAPAADPLARWGLSPAQRAAVQAALTFLAAPPAELAPRVGSAALPATARPCDRQPASTSQNNRQPAAASTFAASPSPRSFLIWAVTGAGKTEMIFPLIEAELARGGNVLIATPRRDVVLELRPRVQRAFPERTLVTLYGGSEDRWNRGDITLATTHQLMRFGQAFDLVIIDELDAFPYHNNPELQFAAAQVCKPTGVYVFLSATPPTAMQRDVARNWLQSVRVPVRFHRHPLPVPRLLTITRKQPWPSRLRQALTASLERGAQLFVFVSKIKDVQPTISKLRTFFPLLVIEGTSSTDPDRSDKVNDFRERRTRILVTTTILERGITVPKTDVFILQADSPLFDEASLVQMAGRAGRSKEDPRGFVYFAAVAKTNAQVGAIRQITRMNRIARKKGYLL